MMSASPARSGLVGLDAELVDALPGLHRAFRAGLDQPDRSMPVVVVRCTAAPHALPTGRRVDVVAAGVHLPDALSDFAAQSSQRVVIHALQPSESSRPR